MSIPFVEATYKGFLEPIWINFMAWCVSTGKIAGCHYFGGWGLLWGDGGKLMEECLNTGVVGAKANWYS